MKTNLISINKEEEDNLLITTYIQKGQYPQLLEQMLQPTKTPEERDILLAN